MPMDKKKWYQNEALIILLLLLFFPVGLFLMWKHTNWSPKTKWIVTGVVVVFLLVGSVNQEPETTPDNNAENVVVQETTPTPTTENQPEEAKAEPKEENSTYEINAIVSYNNLALLIENNEPIAWDICKLKINSGVFSDGYVYKLQSMEGNGKTALPLSEFADGDGKRFNIYETKIKDLVISCELTGDNNKKGFGYYSF